MKQKKNKLYFTHKVTYPPKLSLIDNKVLANTMELNLYGSIMTESDKIDFISKIKNLSIKDIKFENDTLFYLSKNNKYVTLIHKYHSNDILNHKISVYTVDGGHIFDSLDTRLSINTFKRTVGNVTKVIEVVNNEKSGTNRRKPLNKINTSILNKRKYSTQRKLDTKATKNVREFSTSRVLNLSKTFPCLSAKDNKDLLGELPFAEVLDTDKSNKEAFDVLPFSEEFKDVANNKEAFAELPGSTCYTEENTLDAEKTENQTVKGDDSNSDTETVKGNNTDSDTTNTYETGSDSSGYNHSESSTEQDPFVLERYLHLPQNPSSSNSSSSGTKSSVDSHYHTNNVSSPNTSDSSSG
jgi:hypothetical protein